MRLVGTLLLVLLSFSTLADVVISDAKIRLLPPGVPNTAAYFVIENKGDKDLVLVGAQSNAAKTLELHNHVMEGEVMKMLKQDKVTIPAGQTLTFAPGGLHVMLFGLTAPLSDKQKIDISLVADSGEVYPFVAIAAKPGSHSHSHHGHH